jgi:hypothetical protein
VIGWLELRAKEVTEGERYHSGVSGGQIFFSIGFNDIN